MSYTRRALAANLAVLITSVLAIGCCDKSSRRIGPFYDFGHDFRLSPVEQDGTPRAKCKTDEGVNFCVTAEGSRFFLEVENGGSKAIRVNWRASEFRDENGESHRLYFFSDTVRPPEVLTAGLEESRLPARSSDRFVVAPVHKTYNIVEGCRDTHVFMEPLVPSRLDFERPDLDREKVEMIEQSKRPIELRLAYHQGSAVKHVRLFWILKRS